MNRAGWTLILSALLAPSLFAQAAISNRLDVITGGGGAQKYLLTTNLSVLAQPIAGEKSEAGALVHYSGFLGMFDGGLLAPTNVFATTNIESLIQLTWYSVTGASGYDVRRNSSNDLNSAASLSNNVVSTNYDDSTAGHNTNYFYWVRAREEFNFSPFSGVVMGHRQCAVPTNVAASKAEFTNKVAVTWSAVNGATRYLLYRNTNDSSGSSGILSNNVSSTNYDDVSAAPGMQYYYFVRAANSVCTGDFSAGAEGYIKSAVPVVTASKGVYTNKVRVSWTEPPAATHYFVYRNTATNPPAVALTDTTNLVYDDFASDPGVLYYFFVKSADNVSTSDFSAYNTGWLTSAPPASLSATRNTHTNQVQLTWTAVAGTVAYRIYRAESGSKPVNFMAVSTAASFTDATPAPGILYYYWVEASNAVVISTPSDPAEGVARLWPPTGLTASQGDFFEMIPVSWNASTNAASYEIRRDTDPDNEPGEFLATSTAINYNDDRANQGLNYYYWVKAINSVSTSAVSRTASAGYLKLTVPTGVTATKGVFTHKIRVEWNSVTGATSYVIQRAPPSLDALYDQAGSPPYDDINAAIGTKYGYTVKAKKGNTTSEASAPDTGWRRSVFADYDGDSKSDPALLNKISGVFRVYSSAGGYPPFNVNMTYDGLAPPATIPYDSVAGDYDGNGKSEPAMYQQTSGMNSIGLWRVYFSYSGYAKIISRNFGGAGIKPLSGDYDRDGTNDFVVYQSSQPGWMAFLLSSYNYTPDIVVPLAEDGWIPVAGDYDGDGYTDPALYIPASGQFAAFLSSAGWNKTNLLDIGPDYGYFIPVAGDYDGDGVFDPCLYNPGLGLMGALLSSDGQVRPWSFGAPPADCVPVGGDYDGDGITDPMIYGESSGYWAVFLSSNTNTPLAVSGWGGPGWVPVR